jgi:hypothetical protein
MTAPLRWPLHPPPSDGEALSSWLTRIAAAHHIGLEELLANNLGNYTLDIFDSTDIDIDPPVPLLIALQERTGFHRGELHRMTVAGHMPWLLDTLEPSDDPDAFTTYTRQHQVLIACPDRPSPPTHRWRAWLPRAPLYRACRACATEPHPVPGLTLLHYLPITLTCRRHGCYLDVIHRSVDTRILWVDDEAEPRPAPPAVQLMDQRTHDALTDGIVQLPRRPVHAGIWFRLLRTIIDELSTPIIHSRRHSHTLSRIWASIDQPPRGGQLPWRPFESLAWPAQQLHLEAAAATIAMLEDGSIESAGVHGALFRTEPHCPINDGRTPTPETRSASTTTQPIDRWKATADNLNEVIALARSDPAEAEKLYQFLSLRPNREHETRQLLTDLRITDYPSSHNPDLDRSCTVE